jgi:hypothetical protein
VRECCLSVSIESSLRIAGAWRPLFACHHVLPLHQPAVPLLSGGDRLSKRPSVVGRRPFSSTRCSCHRSQPPPVVSAAPVCGGWRQPLCTSVLTHALSEPSALYDTVVVITCCRRRGGEGSRRALLSRTGTQATCSVAHSQPPLFQPSFPACKAATVKSVKYSVQGGEEKRCGQTAAAHSASIAAQYPRRGLTHVANTAHRSTDALQDGQMSQEGARSTNQTREGGGGKGKGWGDQCSASRGLT